MRVARTRAELDAALREAKGRVGFVPTMGGLHAGHLKLVDTARSRADFTVASIFVNPLQFGPGEDYASYPRTFDGDCVALETAGVDLVFAPGVDDMYPDGEAATPKVQVPLSLGDLLEGAARPGHFDGVATVVRLLFELVRPDLAVFGEKDFQQLLVIRWLVRHCELNVEIVGERTVREPDGLAMSSRNRYLTADERARAPALFKALTEIAGAIREGHRDWVRLAERGRAALAGAGLVPEYFEVRSADDLSAPTVGAPLVILTAARLGNARLIDSLRV